jgi:hypothetical protein
MDALFRAAQARANSGDEQATAAVAAALFAAGKAANESGDFAAAEKLFQSGFLVLPRVRAAPAPVTRALLHARPSSARAWVASSALARHGVRASGCRGGRFVRAGRGCERGAGGAGEA